MTRPSAAPAIFPETGAISAGAARRALAARLRRCGLREAVLEARFLVEAIAGRHVAPDTLLDEAQLARLADWAARREAGEPVWRIVGEREFWGMPFSLSPGTLEPRPDSETLVEAALAALAARRSEPLSMLDLGTGTGCLLIALLSECPDARGLGIDIAPDAVATARANAASNGLAGRATFREGDWTDGLTERFDLVVSNPPNIASGDLATLAIEVRGHDPLTALDGGRDGLDAYRRLAEVIPPVLAPRGLVVLEIGAGQEADVAALMAAAGLGHRETRADLGGHGRAMLFSGAV